MTSSDEQPSLEIGSLWRHTNGNEYTVVNITNVFSDRQEKYPVTVSYVGANGHHWSRKLSDWHRSMTLVRGALDVEPAHITIAALRAERDALKETLGDLHEDHKSLLDEQAEDVALFNKTATKRREAEVERDTLKATVENLSWQIEHEGCIAAHPGEFTRECGFVPGRGFCGLCRLATERDALKIKVERFSADLDGKTEVLEVTLQRWREDSTELEKLRTLAAELHAENDTHGT